MLRGNSQATVDDKGRLKIPTHFRRLIEETHGGEFFITSLDGSGVHIYPLPVWLSVEAKIATLPRLDPAVSRLVNLISYYGAEAGMDKQGRVLISSPLREAADVVGTVSVLGKQDHLEVWNEERLLGDLKANPLSEEDRRILSGLGL